MNTFNDVASRPPIASTAEAPHVGQGKLRRIEHEVFVRFDNSGAHAHNGKRDFACGVQGLPAPRVSGRPASSSVPFGIFQHAASFENASASPLNQGNQLAAIGIKPGKGFLQGLFAIGELGFADCEVRRPWNQRRRSAPA